MKAEKEETARLKAEAEAKLKAEQEAARLKAEAEAKLKAEQEAEAKLKAEQQAIIIAKEEIKKKEEEKVAEMILTAKKKYETEAKLRIAKIKAEKEEKIKAEEELKRKEEERIANIFLAAKEKSDSKLALNEKSQDIEKEKNNEVVTPEIIQKEKEKANEITEDIIAANEETILKEEFNEITEVPIFKIYLGSDMKKGRPKPLIDALPEIVYIYEERTSNIYTVGYFDSPEEATLELEKYSKKGFDQAKVIGIYKGMIVSKKIAEYIIKKSLEEESKEN